jgi:hypothetical protein
MIAAWMHEHYPGNYIQFQSGNNLDQSQVAQSVRTAEAYGADSVEWYEDEAVNGNFQTALDGYQTWALSQRRS